MIDAIKFVQGAVAKKDYAPELTHFTIKAGRITGFNGNMALSSPIDLDLDVRPQATTFAKACQACDDVVTMHVTPAGRLSIKAGKFRALVQCLPDDYAAPVVEPNGEQIDLGPEFMKAIRAVSSFQGVDASRPWAMGIMLRGQSAYATNNICFVEYWHGHTLPMPINIPAMAIKELLRIKQEPTSVVTDGHTITFHFEDERWLRCNLLGDNWPDQAFSLFEMYPFDYVETPEGFFDALTELKPFLDTEGRIYFWDNALSTSASDDAGASFEVEGVQAGPAFAFTPLALLEGATHVDFTNHPKPCGFLKDSMRGMIIGLNL